MTRSLRLLLVEDSADDAALLLRELRRAGYEPQFERVDSRAALERALDSHWDLILCDYRVPDLDAPTTLGVVRDRRANTPCIVVSGTVSEEHAVTAMRHGARDFVSKDKLGRLVPAIERELRDSEVRIKHARAVSTLRATEASFRAAFELIPDGVLIHRDGQVVHANSAAAELFGAPSVQELLGRAVSDLLPDADRDLLEVHDGPERPPAGATSDREDARGDAVDVTGASRLAEMTLARSDGRSISVEARAMPVLFEGHRATLAVIRDVSARRDLLARTVQLDRMIAIGTLAAGVGHEINNPLAYIMANLGYASDELGRLQQKLTADAAGAPAGAELAHALGEVVTVLGEAQDGARRIRDIARDLKTYARSDDQDEQLVDVREAAESALRMAAPEIRQRAHVTREFDAVAPVRASRSRVGQVLLNLIMNAAQAIPEGKPDTNEILVRIRSEGGEVVVEIKDTGGGIAPENVERLFTPFFTTKPVGKGTGLGLSISRGIVRALGGDIRVQSAVGQGTTMTVTFPAADAAAPSRRRSPRVASRRGRVLFVDDERMVGSAFQRALSREHDVVVVVDPNEALARVRSGEPFDVVFCDLNMPAMTGVDLLAAIERSRPALEGRVVVVTGDEADAHARTALAERGAPVLEKPLDMQQVRAYLARLLAP